MRLLQRDLRPVSLIKFNGGRYDDIPANLQSNCGKMLTEEMQIPFEEGDIIERTLPNGITERYEIIQINYSSNFMNMDIKKIIQRKESGGIVVLKESESELQVERKENISQQINNYYGTVVNGNVSSSQIVSGNNNTVNYNEALALNAIQEIEKSLKEELVSGEDLECAMELLEDVSQKIKQKKKANLVKATFSGLKDFAVSVGANVTATLILAKMQGLF